MEKSNDNVRLFEKLYNKCHFFLKIVGILIDEEYKGKRFLYYRLYYYFNVSWVFTDMIAQFARFVSGIVNGESFTQLTNLAPCLVLCIVGFPQAINFKNKLQAVRKLLKTIFVLLSSVKTSEENVRFVKKQTKSISVTINVIYTIMSLGVAFFGLMPVLKIIKQHYSDEQIKLTLPFLVLYPFDIYKTHNYVISYIHVMWSGAVQATFFTTPYFFCYACITIISCQFHFLCQDIKQLIPNSYKSRKLGHDENIRLRLNEIILRHKELIRKRWKRNKNIVTFPLPSMFLYAWNIRGSWYLKQRSVEVVEEIFSSSNLLNVVASSILICLTAFNVMMVGDIILVLPFLQFLGLSLGQIFLICYYGDLIMRSGLQISDAIYECNWYNVDKGVLKSMLIIFVRAQKPCKLTAYGFSDINLSTFSRILSSSSSYFALLRSLYFK